MKKLGVFTPAGRTKSLQYWKALTKATLQKVTKQDNHYNQGMQPKMHVQQAAN